MLNGRLAIKSVPEGGTLIRVRVPFACREAPRAQES